MSEPFTVTTKLEGGDQLLKELAALGGNVRSTARTSIRNGTKIVQAQAEMYAGRLGGKQGKHTAIKMTQRSSGLIEGKLGPSKRFWFFRFYETGATSHEITGQPLVFEGELGLVVIGAVSHPGMAARPWLRPAFDTKQTEAVQAVGDTFRKAIEARKAIIDGTAEDAE